MSATNKSKLFEATTTEAYTIKTLVEVLQNILTEVCFEFTPSGINLLTTDTKQQIVVQLSLSAVNFNTYYCPKTIPVGITLAHLNKMVKTVKKQDNSITLSINAAEKNFLVISTIQADTNQPVDSKLKIQNMNKMNIPMGWDYYHPAHIPTTAYQKMCKDFNSFSEKLNVYIKGSYVKFSAAMEGIMERSMPFGTIDHASTDEEYVEVFNTKSFSNIIKISGLNARMDIYAPKASDKAPLKLSVRTGQLGVLDIYIKTEKQLAK